MKLHPTLHQHGGEYTMTTFVFVVELILYYVKKMSTVLSGMFSHLVHVASLLTLPY